MAEILRTSALSKSFGGLSAVADVDLTVAEGEIHCLIGPNGAGKSTLFKLIVGRYPPSQGTIAFRGEDITSRMSYERVQRGMSIKMQNPSVFKDLPVRQNVHVALQHHVAAGVGDRQQVERARDGRGEVEGVRLELDSPVAEVWVLGISPRMTTVGVAAGLPTVFYRPNADIIHAQRGHR